MSTELQQAWVPVFKSLIWIGVCGNCLAVALLLQKRKITSAVYVVIMSIVDCSILIKLYFCLQNQLPPFLDLYTLVVMSSVQSSMCKMFALIMERLRLDSSVRRTVSGSSIIMIPGKWKPVCITVCAISICVLIVYISLSLDLGSKWRLLLKILQILLLVLPLPGMAYLVINIRRFQKKLALATSTYPMTHGVLDNDSKADRQFTTYLISMAMVSFVTCPIYATVLVVDNILPELPGQGIAIVTSLTVIVQCAVNVCLQLVHTKLFHRAVPLNHDSVKEQSEG
ncbi:uncharacterized protein LOC121386805 [Gigantopelta aegis]|uniref:uncharacterized protein LOC121386805 n=1 Tax=Gigantopelta aegis TaxID=1735272 RepID=UPI001B889A26|nr:uncharacterized protein LOC121386805 [Gigantopelta aegis]XP_041373753.1 uncharacterized protein LOC121386805 [Gigantopelta aegis]